MKAAFKLAKALYNVYKEVSGQRRAYSHFVEAIKLSQESPLMDRLVMLSQMRKVIDSEIEYLKCDKQEMQ